MIALDRAAEARNAYALELLRALIAEPSIEGSKAIGACLDLIETEVEPLANEVRRIDNDGVPSLIARFGPSGAKSMLALSGHVDVVPADGAWTVPPFELFHETDAVRGRGVCDMKGAVAAFVAALHALDDAGLLERCPLELALTGDEEVGSRRGLIPLLAEGAIEAPEAICGEPTGLDVFLGNRGVIWAQVTIEGSGGHAGLTHMLANPIDPALDLARELARVPLTARDERFDPPGPSLTVTKLDAGSANDAVNIVPDVARLSLDRRLVPGEDVGRARETIEAAVATAVGGPFTASLEFLREWPAYAIDADEAIARRSREIVQSCGRPGAIGMDLASNDSSWLDGAGITTVLLGPGDPAEAHTSDERLTLDQLADAIRIYAAICHATCEPKGHG